MIKKNTVIQFQREDWMYSVQLNRWFLKPIGAWPLSFCLTTMDKISSVILSIISCFLIGFLIVPCVLCILLDKESDLDTKIKIIGPLSFCIMAAIKYYILVSRGDKIEKCIQHVRLDWIRARSERYEEDQRIMIDCAKFGRSLAMICAVFMYSGGFFYCTVMPLFAKRVEVIGNETVRSQAFPIYRGLLDPRKSPYFEIVEFIQFLAGFVIYSVTISACSLAAVFVMHACGQFRVVMVKLNDLVDGCREYGDINTVDRRLGGIVQHHLQILGFISRIEDLLHEICLVELVGCTLNICFLGYYLLTVIRKIVQKDDIEKHSLSEYWSFKIIGVMRKIFSVLSRLMEWEKNETIGTLTYFSLLISFTFNIFILCYIGELLTEQCKKVGLMAYMIDWYRLPGKRALGLILMVAISNSSIKLTAGKLVELSLSNFCSVLKSSLAYLSLLRTLTH